MTQVAVKGAALHFSRQTLAIWGICVVVATAAGPFGTLETPAFPFRFLYWLLVVVISTVIGQISRALVREYIDNTRPVLSDLAMVALMVLLFTPVLWLLTNWLLLPDGRYGRGFATLSVCVAIITAAICVSRRVLPGLEPIGYFGERRDEAPGRPRLLERLPEDFEGSILRLTGRDHFVDVITSAGDFAIRMRFADAINEMDAIIGYCTHRSHWVAAAAIVAAERDGGRVQLRLSNGDLIPVSRKYRPMLEEAGIV